MALLDEQTDRHTDEKLNARDKQNTLSQHYNEGILRFYILFSRIAFIIYNLKIRSVSFNNELTTYKKYFIYSLISIMFFNQLFRVCYDFLTA